MAVVIMEGLWADANRRDDWKNHVKMTQKYERKSQRVLKWLLARLQDLWPPIQTTGTGHWASGARQSHQYSGFERRIFGDFPSFWIRCQNESMVVEISMDLWRLDPEEEPGLPQRRSLRQPMTPRCRTYLFKQELILFTKMTFSWDRYASYLVRKTKVRIRLQMCDYEFLITN